MLFPTIRFAIFFALVMPASWLLMPLPGRARREEGGPGEGDGPSGPRWMVPAGLVGAGALLGPLAPAGLPTTLRVVMWAGALALFAIGITRWFELKGLTRWSVFMLAASYIFYGAYDWRFVALLVVSTVTNQAMVQAIDRRQDDRRRKQLLALAVTLNLAVLAWFKYKGFFTESASSILAPLGIDIVPPARALIPPVGISFFTFQALSYVIDAYRRKVRPVPLLDFAVYLSFFPQFVAGPIVRASEFLPQLRTPRDARKVDTGLAFWLISVGLFKKVVVSSYLADAVVDPVFRIPDQHQALDTLVGIYGYAIQIYCDFSGYTDMAIGLALLLGFKFPQNFDAPYTAASLGDFWRRWHMTLSRWLRDYLYIPLGGNQRGVNRALVNLFLTMVIGGLWHGAAWTFVVWGALHGGWLAAERWLELAPTGGPQPGRDPVPPSPPVGAGDEAPVGDGSGGHHIVGGHGDGSGAVATAVEGGGPAATASAEPQVEVVEVDTADAVAGAHLRARLPSLEGLSPTSRRWLGRLVTFHVVCLGWVFFRAPTLTEAFAVLGRLTSLGAGTGVNLVALGTIGIFLATQFVPSDSVGRAQAAFSRLAPWQQGVALAAWLAFTSALAPAGVLPFIYFNF